MNLSVRCMDRKYDDDISARVFRSKTDILTVRLLLMVAKLVEWEEPVWPDLAICWTLGNFLKSLATINLPHLPHS